METQEVKTYSIKALFSYPKEWEIQATNKEDATKMAHLLSGKEGIIDYEFEVEEKINDKH